jgi:4-hydroxybenzoate polyprenyltransferase
MNRWWTYQKERFPLAAHAPLVAAFSYSALSYSSLLRGLHGLPSGRSAVAAFFTSLLFFLQLRIADEFKDFDDDSRYRPYRPVPRGLVKLRELGVIGAGAALGQLLLAIWITPRLIPLLLLTWTYLALMSKEFFVHDWLKARPFTYLWSHMLIMPLVDFYVTACDWMPAAGRAPAGLAWFLIISFFNGIVLEMGRKIRAPEDEETGVETYTFLWGRPQAVRGWFLALSLCAASAFMAARRIDFAWPVAGVIITMLAATGLSGAAFVRTPTTKRAKRIEALSGIWTLLMYLSLGAVPRFLR